MAALSPSSSPRLPSPPPMAEDQLGPNSPLSSEDESNRPSHGHDTGASRRIRPGTKAVDMAEGPPLVELQDIDSAFQLTEHLKSLHCSLTQPSSSSSSSSSPIPLTRTTATQLATPPPGTDRALWLYELCRFLVQRANTIVVALFADAPACSSLTCPEMRASEWQYLCAVHDPPKSCCAIDYCCHTLDWASGVLTSPKVFPSRLSLAVGGDGGGARSNGAGGGGGGKDGGFGGGLGREDQGNATHQVRQLTNIFRRVYRIFAHAWFQHREVFWHVEGRTGLYVFFKTVCDVYSLIPEDNYTVPPEAEGTEGSPASGRKEVEGEEEEFRRLEKQKTLTVLSRERPESLAKGEEDEKDGGEEVMGNQTVSTGSTTKRHRQTTVEPRSIVSTVIEEKEEDEDEDEDERQHGPVEQGEVVADPPPTAMKQPDGEHDIPELRIDASQKEDEVAGGEEAKTEHESALGNITVVSAQDEPSAEDKEPASEGDGKEEPDSNEAAAEEKSEDHKPEEAASEEA